MKITFLGTGTSTGVPVVGCHCAVCTSPNSKNQRLRQSVKIESGPFVGLIDTTPDLRTQLLRSPVPRLDFILYTHSHSDHLMGLDDIRPFNFRQREPVVAFASPRTASAIRRAFSYIWDHSQSGGGKPQLDLREIESGVTFAGLEIVPIPVRHGNWTIYGYRIGPFAYITDTNGIPESSLALLEGVEVLALDGLRPGPPHPTHFTIGEAVEAGRQVGAGTTYIIHLAHEVDHDLVEASLPEGFHLAWDGLTLEF
jgi:phosphoribosyl 1,2-cyclic phosphate phosphodiesterase